MDYGMVIFVLTGALVSVASAQTRQFYLVDRSLNWTDAQSYCRNNYTDLATIENNADTEVILGSTNFTGKAWIGLYDDLVNSWRWSLNDSSFYGDGETEFRNWYDGEPNNRGGQEHCVVLSGGGILNGKWDDRNCVSSYAFICYNGTANGTADFVRVNELMNWTDAQSYCRERYVDLASIRNASENEVIKNVAGTTGSFVWIGLHRDKEWSDGSTSLFRNWTNNQPNNSNGACVTINFQDGGWSDDDCSRSFKFLCYRPGLKWPSAEKDWPIKRKH